MNVQIGKFYEDNDENVYRCIALKQGPDSYMEAVMEVQGYADNTVTSTLLYCIFYFVHYAWLDRENPDFKLTQEVEYFPHIV